MDKIFFAIIAMAFVFAGIHTFDHEYSNFKEKSTMFFTAFFVRTNIF